MQASVNPEPPAPAPLPHPALRRASDPAYAQPLLPTGLPPFDTAFGGLPLRHTHLLTGMPGSGATALLHGLLATTTRVAPVLLFDPDTRFHPAAAAAAGVHLPHLLWISSADRQKMEHALRLALRADACALIVWDARQLPAAALLDRLRPHVRRSGSALLFVTADASAPSGAIDGMTIAVTHAAWGHGGPQDRGCGGRSVTAHVTDHRRGQTIALSLAVTFPQPLPRFLPLVRKGGGRDASTAGRGALGAGALAAMRGTG